MSDRMKPNQTSVPRWVRSHRSSWRYRGQERPPGAFEPGPGQESVWDYPRPPAIVPDQRSVEVRLGALLVARSDRCFRVLETASPPTFYLPPQDVDRQLLVPGAGVSHCEWKGAASYWDLATNARVVESVAWSYRNPFAEFAELRDYFSFYPGRLECYLDGERAAPQPGDFYGGWVTSEIVGPFKGEPGSAE